MEKMRHRLTAALVTVCLALAGEAVVSPSLAAADTGTFTNSTAMTIPATGTGPGPASLYPSNITVSGMAGSVSKVTVTLTNLTHTFPEDLNAMLVGPAGQNLLFMSDAGGNFDLNGVTLTFDDAAAGSLPKSTQISSGTFDPTNYADLNGNDSFPAPAPAPSAATALSTFDNTNPNGTWSLYVMDDFASDAGSLGSWTLTIETSPTTVTVEQADGQSDPTAASPILFDVTFSRPVTGFTSDDVTIGGTAGADTAGVSGSGTDYTIEVSGMTSLGTVTASIPADAAEDGGGSGNAASTSTDNTVTFNPPPVAVDDAVSANEDTPLNVAAPGVLANDTEADGVGEAALVSGPAHGTLTLAADGGFQYTPAPNFRSQDSFTYTVNDGLTESGPATVTITVTPTSSVDREQYVDGVYQVLLGRPADSAGLAFWTGQLAAGLSRSDFTRLVEASGEGIDTQIRRSYLAILDRAPDAAGLAAWHTFLAGGGTTRMLEAQLAGSPEFLAGAGGTNAGFVAEAYRELLGREADSAGNTFWQNALTAGASRTAVAQALIDSTEGVAFQLAGIYNLALGRVPDAAGATFWATQVRTGDRRFVLAALTASDEFFALSTAG